MANYKDIKGTTVQVQSGTQPTTYPQAAGELYYNSSNGDYEFLGIGAGTWATGGDLGTARKDGAGLGIQTAAILAGGGDPAKNNTETYNGTSWSEVNELNVAKYGHRGAGTTTAGIIFLGHNASDSALDQTEVFNGTSWSETHELNTARFRAGSSIKGTSTAVIAFGGEVSGDQALTESYNGSSWTELANLSTARTGISGAGTTASAFAARGNPPTTNATEEWTIPSSLTSLTITD